MSNKPIYRHIYEYTFHNLTCDSTCRKDFICIDSTCQYHQLSELSPFMILFCFTVINLVSAILYSFVSFFKNKGFKTFWPILMVKFLVWILFLNLILDVARIADKELLDFYLVYSTILLSLLKTWVSLTLSLLVYPDRERMIMVPITLAFITTNYLLFEYSLFLHMITITYLLFCDFNMIKEVQRKIETLKSWNFQVEPTRSTLDIEEQENQKLNQEKHTEELKNIEDLKDIAIRNILLDLVTFFITSLTFYQVLSTMIYVRCLLDICSYSLIAFLHIYCMKQICLWDQKNALRSA